MRKLKTYEFLRGEKPNEILMFERFKDVPEEDYERLKEQEEIKKELFKDSQALRIKAG